MDSNLWVLLLSVVVVAAWLLLKRASFVGEAKAKALLQRGARVIDVRTPDEFAADPVRGALNVPLNGIARQIESVVPDKTQPVLLHCLSGGRSGLAQRLLRRRGYQVVFNLGSVRRARRIVEGL